MQRGSEQNLRSVAILVDSLDPEDGLRMLASLPPTIVADVKAKIQALGEVDPKERREVVAKFRQSAATAEPSDARGVEIESSLLARFDQPDVYRPPAPTETPTSSPQESFDDVDVESIIELIAGEHPQTVAIVVSRLSGEMAVEVLTRLSASLQVDVLARLTDSNPTDDQALEVIESQLTSWLEQHREQKQRAAAGLQLVEKILSRSSSSQRDVLLGNLRRRNPQLATLVEGASKSPLDKSPIARADLKDVAASRHSSASEQAHNSWEIDRPSPAERLYAQLPTNFASNDPLTELESASDAALLEAIGQCDSEVVALALAGASETLLERVLSRLPRRQAKQVRKQLRNRGPMRLMDLLDAQRQLAEIARRVDARRSAALA